MPELERLPFEIEEVREDAGPLRLRLSGELDLLVGEELEARLRQLQEAGDPVLLDLSGLQFIDSTGLRVIITAVIAARRAGWSLEVERQLPNAVERVLRLVQADQLLWPDGEA